MRQTAPQNLYNTALLSQRQEVQGGLKLPIRVLDRCIQPAEDGVLTIALAHHTYPWFESNNSLEFRRHIESTSDLVLMGHQHFDHSFIKETFTGNRLLYVEGCALQDEAHPAQSGFNVIELELPGRKQRITHFEWSKDHYTAITDQDWTALVENSVFRHGFRVNDEFARFLNDPGAGYTHSHKREVKLRDIFVYPDLTVRGALPKGQPNEILAESFESFLRDSSCIVFEGEAQSGRTSLAKIAYLDLSNSLGLVPVFIDGRELKSATEQAVINRVTKAVSDQYSPKATERFNQLDSAKRVLIVDDWHRSPLNSQGREELLALVGKRFGKIFLFSDPMFDVKEFATMGKDQASLLRFQHASLRQFGHKSRGRLIEKWLMLGREHSYDEEKLAREILEIENVITTLMGKNTLPKFPFIVHHRSFGVWHQR